jgi:hypothetical protein
MVIPKRISSFACTALHKRERRIWICAHQLHLEVGGVGWGGVGVLLIRQDFVQQGV